MPYSLRKRTRCVYDAWRLLHAARPFSVDSIRAVLLAFDPLHGQDIAIARPDGEASDARSVWKHAMRLATSADAGAFTMQLSSRNFSQDT